VFSVGAIDVMTAWRRSSSSSSSSCCSVCRCAAAALHCRHFACDGHSTHTHTRIFTAYT